MKKLIGITAAAVCAVGISAGQVGASSYPPEEAYPAYPPTGSTTPTTVLPSSLPSGGGNTGGGLPTTGAGIAAIAVTATGVVAAGSSLVLAARRKGTI